MEKALLPIGLKMRWVALASGLAFATPAFAQVNTNCQRIGNQIHCQSYENQAPPPLTPPAPLPQYHAPDITGSFGQGYALGEQMRRNREDREGQHREEEQQKRQIPPQITAWVKERPWLGVDKEMSATASALYDAYANSHPDGRVEDALSDVDSKIARLYPERVKLWADPWVSGVIEAARNGTLKTPKPIDPSVRHWCDEDPKKLQEIADLYGIGTVDTSFCHK